jgi:hypothetical protein
VKLFPAESVTEGLTEDTESSALAGWPALKTAGLMPNVMRAPLCAWTAVENAPIEPIDMLIEISIKNALRRMIFLLRCDQTDTHFRAEVSLAPGTDGRQLEGPPILNVLGLTLNATLAV